MKGIVFTIDAIFALIIAMASISILLYFHYFSQTPYIISYEEAQSTMAQLSSTTLYQMQNSSSIAQAIVRQTNGANYTWPQFMKNAYSEAAGAFGPSQPFISYIFTANSKITTGIVAGYGSIYFATGSTLYAVNATTGATIWSRGTSSIVSTPVLYDNMLIYANTTNITAVNPINGKTAFTTNSIEGTLISSLLITTPLLAYDGKIVFGTSSDNVYAIYSGNGTEAWSVSLGAGEQPQFLAVAGGNLAIKTTSGELALIGTQGTAAGIIWSKPSLGTSSAVSSMQDILYFGNGDNVNATYTNGTSVPGFPGGTSQIVYAVAPYGSVIYYQLQNGVIAVSTTGSERWSISVPGSFGNAVTGSSSLIASNNYLYALWQNGLAIINTTTHGFMFARLPYSPISNESLAYGRLYVVANNKIIAFGSCPASSGENAFYASATMFANGYASCADSLLNSIKTTENYDVFVNNTFGPSMSIAKFNGNNAYAKAQNEAWLNTTLVTASFWINISAYPSGAVRVLSYGDNDTATGHYSGWFFALNSSGVLRFYIMNGTAQTVVPTAMKLALNKWYNIVGLYNGSYLGLYVNGVIASQVGQRVAPKKISTSIVPPGPQINLTIGSGTPISNVFFNGYISNVQIYAKPLPPVSISELNNEGLQSGPVSNYLVSWYPLQGDTNDYSNYSNAAYPYYISFVKNGYVPASYASAYEISRASIPIAILNYTTGNVMVESAGVFAWH
ncbi:MAG: LamG-like jellyroll fold domain-containing protein [Candidatus Micrarchaeaceae archaeon]